MSTVLDPEYIIFTCPNKRKLCNNVLMTRSICSSLGYYKMRTDCQFYVQHKSEAEWLSCEMTVKNVVSTTQLSWRKNPYRTQHCSHATGCQPICEALLKMKLVPTQHNDSVPGTSFTVLKRQTIFKMGCGFRL